jgi:hypothetical protein
MERSRFDALVNRATAAVRAARDEGGRANRSSDDSEQLRRRAHLLRGFLRRSREAGVLHRRCAWCGRIEIEDEFVRIEDVLSQGLPERQSARATDSICPECLERTLREAGLR